MVQCKKLFFVGGVQQKNIRKSLGNEYSSKNTNIKCTVKYYVVAHYILSIILL